MERTGGVEAFLTLRLINMSNTVLSGNKGFGYSVCVSDMCYWILQLQSYRYLGALSLRFIRKNIVELPGSLSLQSGDLTPLLAEQQTYST